MGFEWDLLGMQLTNLTWYYTLNQEIAGGTIFQTTYWIISEGYTGISTMMCVCVRVYVFIPSCQPTSLGVDNPSFVDHGSRETMCFPRLCYLFAS